MEDAVEIRREPPVVASAFYKRNQALLPEQVQGDRGLRSRYSSSPDRKVWTNNERLSIKIEFWQEVGVSVLG